MEAFKVFATLSLVDMISGPLNAIRRSMSDTGNAVAGLGQRMGNLALAMAPIALVSGGLLMGFGSCVNVAAKFEDQMAKVGAVSRASKEDMALLEAEARRLGATTQFSASQVGEAQMYLAMAGFKVKDNVAALPGVLNLAAATATDLGRAADISSDILSGFGLKASEMGRVADVLALTCSTANTNMEMLGETMKYVAPVARQAGMSLEETAAMAGLLGNVGIKSSMAGTTIKGMLNRLSAPVGKAQETLKKLGITVQDTAGNLRSPITILGEMATKLQGMGTAQQIAALKTIVGEEAIAGFAELINQEGIGAISKYVAELNSANGTVAGMARTMNDTFLGSLRNLSSAWESLQITIGKLFMPVLRKGVDGLTAFVGFLDRLAQSPVGAFFLQMLGWISSVILAVTGLSLALWGMSKLGPLILGSLAPVKAGILALGWPVLLLISLGGLLYAAYRKNFGGMADTISRWGKNISTVCRGVVAVFRNLTGASAEIRGELATEIKAAGLEGIVTSIARIVHRIRAFFKGIWDGIDFARPVAILQPVAERIRSVLDRLGSVFSQFFGPEVTSATASFTAFGVAIGEAATVGLEKLASGLAVCVDILGSVLPYIIEHVLAFYRNMWESLDFTRPLNVLRPVADKIGAMLTTLADVFSTVFGGKVGEATEGFAALGAVAGSVASWALEGLATAVSVLADGLNIAANMIRYLVAIFTGDWATACEATRAMWDSLVSAFMSIADLFRIGDWLRSAWQDALEYLGSIDLFESGAKILDTLKQGILSKAQEFKETITGVFSKVRDLLPFSDAREGPLSQLTLSGSRIMTTLAQGVKGGATELRSTVSTALDGVAGMTRNIIVPAALELAGPSMPEIHQPIVAPQIVPPVPETSQSIIAPQTAPPIPENIATPGPRTAAPVVENIVNLSPPAPRLPLTFPIATPDFVPSAVNLPVLPELAPDMFASLATSIEQMAGKAKTMLSTILPDVSLPDIPIPALPELPGFGVPEAPELAPAFSLAPEIVPPGIQAPPQEARPDGGGRAPFQGGGNTTTVHISNLHLPKVQKSSDFLQELEQYVAAFGGDLEPEL